MGKKICFVMDASPEFLGGTSIYVKNFLKFLKDNEKNMKITGIYPGEKDREYSQEKIRWIEIESKEKFPINFLNYTKRVADFLRAENFDLINSQAMAGNYLRYFVPEGFKTNTYHGVGYFFYKIHLGEKSFLKKLGALFYMYWSYFLEKAPVKKADRIISVSEHVKEELAKIYGESKESVVVRSSVDRSQFKKRSRIEVREKLGLDKNKVYGLYVGRGGPWRKGLDRAIKISEEIRKIEPRYSLIIIGPSETAENKRLIEQFHGEKRYIPIADREVLSEYYSASEIFFCFSRYEGGAPVLTLGEAMSSGCLPVCSGDSNQEIIKDQVNGIVISKFNTNDAKKIVNLLKDKRKIKNILDENQKKIETFSVDKWGKEYLKAVEGK